MGNLHVLKLVGDPGKNQLFNKGVLLPGNIQQFNKSGHMPRNTDQGEGFRE